MIAVMLKSAFATTQGGAMITIGGFAFGSMLLGFTFKMVGKGQAAHLCEQIAVAASIATGGVAIVSSVNQIGRLMGF